MDKTITTIQVALFFEDIYSGDFESLSLDIKKEFAGHRSMQILPIGDNAPGEIPRLILQYEDFNIHISKNRGDIFFNNGAHDENKIKKLFQVLARFNLTINRVGFIKTGFIKCPIDKLKELLNYDDSSKIEEIKIRINKPIINDHKYNNIEDLAYGSMVRSGITSPGVIYQRDINVHMNSLRNFDESNLVTFIKFANSESDSFILFKYEKK